MWCGWGMGLVEFDGVMVFVFDGMLIGWIVLLGCCVNLCFGGWFNSCLFMVVSYFVYVFYVNVVGVFGG